MATLAVMETHSGTASAPGAARHWPEAAILLAAFAMQVPLVLNADLGWLLTVCEKMLAGARLGVDVIELNPPLSVLMYMPAAFLGRALAIPSHLVVIATVLGLAWWSTATSARALGPMLADAAMKRRAVIVLLAVLTLVPGATFAQREHFAVLGMLPFLAVAAADAVSASTRARSLSIVAGLGAGFAMCIKPHFALVAALPLLWTALQRRSVRPLLALECWIAGAAVVGYYGAVMIAYPEYFSVYPRWAAITYLPLRVPFDSFFGVDVLYCVTAIVAMIWAGNPRGKPLDRSIAIWSLAALGGFLSYVIQGKGFAYMRLPAATFGLLAPLLTRSFLSDAIWDRANRWRPLAVALCAWIVALWLVPANNDYRTLQDPIRANAPLHPKMLAVASNVGLGEPLVHKLEGEWASGAGSQLMSAGALFMIDEHRLTPEQESEARRIVATERERLRRDLQLRRPDVLLIDSNRFGYDYDWEAWARADPAISREIDRNYRFLERRKGVSIWIRRSA